MRDCIKHALVNKSGVACLCTSNVQTAKLIIILVLYCYFVIICMNITIFRKFCMCILAHYTQKIIIIQCFLIIK